ncbi:MAG: hypothetical protein IPI14_01075 [Polaromonas sp.]|nr:hypothetical protein [Polaromonas sp.]
MTSFKVKQLRLTQQQLIRAKSLAGIDPTDPCRLQRALALPRKPAAVFVDRVVCRSGTEGWPAERQNGGRSRNNTRRSNVDRAEPLSASVKMTRVRVLESTHLRFGKAKRHNLSIIQKMRIASTK